MTVLGDNNNFTGDASLSSYKPTFRCVASYYPLTSFIRADSLIGSNYENPSRFIPMLGGSLADNMPLAKSLSPAEILTPDAPPVLLLHGNCDQILPFAQSRLMKYVADSIGANVQLFVVQNGMHSFGNFPGTTISPTMDEINIYSANFMITELTSPNTNVNSIQINSEEVFIYSNIENKIVVNTKKLQPASKVSVYNSVGQKIFDKQLATSLTVIDKQLKSGIYLVSITNEGKTVTRKIILN